MRLPGSPSLTVAVALLSPALLGGCAAGAIAVQAFPLVIGGGAAAGADDRSPFRHQRGPVTPPRTDALTALDAHLHDAECGDAQSQYRVALAMDNAFNASPDRVEIYKWYKLAQMGHSAPASARVADLDTQMPGPELAEARRRAAAWTPRTEGCDAGG